MTFVLKFDNKTLGFVEYLGTGHDMPRTTLDPGFANVFDTRKEANNFLKKNVAWDVKFKTVTLAHAKKQWRKLLDDGLVMREIPYKSNLSRKYNGEKPDQVLKWWIQTAKVSENSVTYEDYTTWPKLYSVFEHLWDIQKYHSNDYRHIYTTFQLRVGQDSTFATFKRELYKVISHVTFLNDDGHKIFDIFDHFLSEGGNTVCLVMLSDNKFAVSNSVYIDVEGTLKDCFEYLKRERYYE